MNISEKLEWQHLFKKLGEAETHRLHLIGYYTHTPWKTTSTIKTNRDCHVFSFGYQPCTWQNSGSFCWQNPCSCCNSGIDLVVVLEKNFFKFSSNTKSRKYVNCTAVVLTNFTLLFPCCSNTINSNVGKQTKISEIVVHQYIKTKSWS